MSEKTAAAWINLGSEILEKAGVDGARSDARELLAFSLPEVAASSVPLGMRLVSDSQSERFLSLVKRRALREPLQHILGSAGILELTIKSDSRALIPRYDSAEVLVLAFTLMITRRNEAFNVADLGTGSGVLLAEFLNEFSRAKGIAVERDPAALSLAHENFETLGFSDRTECFQGSWTEWTGWADCDLIISNPPYIRSDVIPTLQPEVRDHDPIAALDGGVDGLDAYREITALAGARMKSGASLVFEIGFDQKDAVSQLLFKAGFTDLRHKQDLGGQDRAIAALKS